ncbi:MAG: putative transposase [Frankiales bacterium]|nr:putative transposase [Frankiales bacterium]
MDNTNEALAILLRPGNAGSNTATDHLIVLDRALTQIPDRGRSKNLARDARHRESDISKISNRRSDPY